jgi:hypothetical protein
MESGFVEVVEDLLVVYEGKMYLGSYQVIQKGEDGRVEYSST